MSVWEAGKEGKGGMVMGKEGRKSVMGRNGR